MKLVNRTYDLESRFGLKEALRLIKEYGFDGYDYSFSYGLSEKGLFDSEDYIERAKEIRAYADTINLPCLQAHSVYTESYSDIETAIKEHSKVLEICGILGTEIVVIHPCKQANAESNFKLMYSKLLPIAKRLGVKIACENIFTLGPAPEYALLPASCGTPEDFIKFIDYADDPYLVGCLDIGHASLKYFGGATQFIYALGNKRLKALHIHDNDLNNDLHMFPLVGKINWNEVTKALSDIDYQGHFTFECDYYMSKFPDELVGECLTLLEKTGRYLINKIENG